MMEERLSAFLASVEEYAPEYLRELRSAAEEEGVPIIRRDMERLLTVLLAMTHPRKILEIGTGVGYSALVMREYAPEAEEILTVEDFAPRQKKAEQNIRKADQNGTIRLIKREAEGVIRTLPEGEMDFIFLDAAKGQYPVLLPELKRVLRVGGTLLTDNVLFGDAVLESRFLSPRRDRPIHKRMREYLRELLTDASFRTTVLSLGDGAAVSVKL